ncbi:MAG TPA: hypothetical protein VGE16_15680 [Albitalea sp.]
MPARSADIPEMDTGWPIFVAAGAALCALVAAASRWWHGKQLAALAARLAKSERAREYALQQAAQARQQIEKLQRDIAAARRAGAAAAPTSRTPTSRREPAKVPTLSDSPALPMPASGFADTQPL